MTETEQEAFSRRYKWLRENWDAISGNTWREPIAAKLDAHIDAAMRDPATVAWNALHADGG